MKNKLLLLFLCLSGISTAASAQLTQTIRGIVLDKNLQTPITGATVAIQSSNLQVLTDSSGYFSFSGISVGRQSIIVSHISYQTFKIENILVNSGKELVLNVNLDEKFTDITSVKISAKKERNRPVNDLAGISSRTFTVEETQKYAAAVNDPGRMVSSYAGVASADDGGNTIVIRGNAPNGLLWRLEGVEIPNPNHFSGIGASGGGISILSVQLLANSDFMTGAFTPEYGNAMSGVFDLHLRKGNNQKRENTFQASVLGIDLASEGPIKGKKNNGSYLVNYRYSTLGLLSKMGLDITSAKTTFQDLSFNIAFPNSKLGQFGLFGFGGWSNQYSAAVKDSTKWKSVYESYGGIYASNTGFAGLSHQLNVNKKTTWRNILAFGNAVNIDATDILNKEYKPELAFESRGSQQKLTLSSVVTRKLNARNTMRIGIYTHHTAFNYLNKQLENKVLTTFINTKNNTQIVQGFAQIKSRISRKFTLNGGVHGVFLALNNTWSAEPRMQLKWDVDNRNSISFGAGIHGQVQPLGIYFSQYKSNNGETIFPNHSLKISKSIHHVLAYDRTITKYLRLRAEAYFQYLYNLPVMANIKNSFSAVNMMQGFVIDSLSNKGTGQNKGLEITLDKAFANNYYLLISSSLYDSKYKGSDNVWRNTRFNGRFTSAITGGKEIEWTKNKKVKVFAINLKVLYMGGFRETPIDVEQSRINRETVRVDQRAFEIKLPDYFRSDVRFSIKTNHKNYTGTLSIDFQNLTNRKNYVGSYYDIIQDKTIKYTGMGILPVLAYRIEF